MSQSCYRLVVSAFTGVLLAANAALANEPWVEIPLAGQSEYELPNGDLRTIDPSCSAGPRLDDNGDLVAANAEYSFFVQQGDPRRLLIFLDGGGACWDADTCIGSPLLGASTYSQTVDETAESLAAADGIADANNPDNPYAEYTKVFVPYCTGDVFWGAKDTTYELADPPVAWTVRHRGTDNFLAVLDWLRRSGGEAGINLEEVRRFTLSGASAGAYGTLLAFPYAAELVPNARQSVLADAGVGVINESFYRTALYDPDAPEAANWGLADALPEFAGFDQNFLATFVTQPLALPPAWYATLAQYAPRARFAALTSNLDLTQVSFYALMESLDGRPLDDPLLPFEWYLKMQLITSLTEGLPNYRTYLEGGTYHTLIGGSRYYQPGESGVSARDWNRAMITLGFAGWDNIDVGSPF